MNRKDRVVKRRVVLTGMGAVTPLGCGVQNFWSDLIAGRCGVDRITLFDSSNLPSKIGAEVKHFHPTDYLPPKLVRETDRFIHFALVTADQALEESGLDMGSVDPYRVGIVFGTTVGGVTTITEAQTEFASNTKYRVKPHFMPKMLPNLAAAQIAIRHGIKGLSLTLSTACASGTDVIGIAMSLLQAGAADVIIAGASDSIYCKLVFAGLCSARAMSTRNDEPAKASRPFDRQRDGMVMGEGGGSVVLEGLDHVRKRKARPLAELLGYANCGDGFHTMAPQPDGKGEIYCMRQALKSASLTPDDIDYINAHGTSTPNGDRVETLAIKEVYGDRAYRIPVSSIKGATGHMIAAAGIVELIASTKAIREGIIPPTINYQEKDPECDLHYVPNEAQASPVTTVMSNSFGFGGQNACLIVRSIRD